MSTQPYQRELSVGDWILTLIVLAVPLVNVVMYLYWAFSGSAHPTRRNFSRASLVLFAIGVAFYLVVLFIGVRYRAYVV